MWRRDKTPEEWFTHHAERQDGYVVVVIGTENLHVLATMLEVQMAGLERPTDTRWLSKGRDTCRVLAAMLEG